MGFRSTMITESIGVKVPVEFLEKYPWVNAYECEDGTFTFPLSSKFEVKFYSYFKDQAIFKDIQQLLHTAERTFDFPLTVVLLHECGGISRVEIRAESITGLEPYQWERAEGVSHDYCYNCVDRDIREPLV